MERGATGTVRQLIEAPREVVYDLVTDVTRMGEWSPECVACEWVDGATGPAVGARFRGRNRHGLARWSNKPSGRGCRASQGVRVRGDGSRRA
jgi:hypothetical protein